MYNAKAYAAANSTSPLASTKIKRRELTEHDVQIEILFCGICHSDCTPPWCTRSHRVDKQRRDAETDG